MKNPPENIVRHPFGFFEVASKPSAEELQAHYSERYYQEAKGSYELTYSDEEQAFFRAKLEQRWAVMSPDFQAPGTMLDVGCGEGFAMAFFQDLGWQVRGLDFSKSGMESQNPQCLEALVVGDVFEEIRSEMKARTQYDVVWLQNVLEHVLDPVGLMRQLHRLVNPGGFLVCTVPNDFSNLQAHAFERGIIHHPFWIAVPDHLSYFSKESLERIGTETGWTTHVVLADFPVDWFLLNEHSNYIKDRTRGKQAHLSRVALENLLNEATPEAVNRFYASLAELGMGRNLTAYFRP